jgi:hypothetical protein
MAPTKSLAPSDSKEEKHRTKAAEIGELHDSTRSLVSSSKSTDVDVEKQDIDKEAESIQSSSSSQELLV